ncbi:MAG: efflux RND transporter periplasmic adaptor subunit [Bacteroidota bacterium]
MKKTFLGSALLLALLFSACGKKEEGSKNNAATQDSLSRANAYQGAPADVKQVIGIGKVEPELDIIKLAANDGGVVTRIGAKEGDQVKAGLTILEVENTVASAKVAQARARVATQEAQVRNDERAVAEAETKLANLQRTLTRVQNLYAKNADTGENLDNARADVDLQKSSIERLRSAAQVNRVRLDEIKSDIAIAERELSLKSVKVPVAGTLLSMDATLGSAVQAQQSFAELAPAGPTIVRCEVDELFADRVRIGQKAVIRQIGLDKTIAEGEIVYAAPQLNKKSLFSETAGEKEDRRVREVKILLKDAQGLLLNSRVECVINIQ